MMEDQDEELKPTFRIRFTISGCGEHSRNSHYAPNKICNEEIDDPSNSREGNESQCYCRLGVSLNCNNIACEAHRKKAFKFVQPQNHKSSLFVNLSDTSGNSVSQQGELHHLFVSPDLDHYIPASPPSPTDSALGSTPLDFESESIKRSSHDNTMNGCNFMNWNTAARPRSSSVTRSNISPRPANNTTDSSNGRRASSSNDLATPANPLANKSFSGNHLAAGISSETICDNTTTNRRAINHNGANLKPLDIVIDVPTSYPMSINAPNNHPISLDDILQVDMESIRLEHECRLLESQVREWEEAVDNLERERFTNTGSRCLIDKLIKVRKHIRELDFQLFKLNLEAQDSDYMSQKLSPLSDNENDGFQTTEIIKLATNLTAGRYGSQIKPGQENTADILDAIPPSGPLQHKQFLTKASSGTDYSEYSRMPIDSRYRHLIPRRNSRQPVLGSPQSESQAYVDSPNRFSPVRPDHFKGDFLSSHVIVSEDSSSSTSGENPH